MIATYADRIAARLSGVRNRTIQADCRRIAAEADERIASVATPANELRAALAGLAMQGLFANPDITARLLANIDADDPENTAIGDFTTTCARMSVGAADVLLWELNK